MYSQSPNPTRWQGLRFGTTINREKITDTSLRLFKACLLALIFGGLVAQAQEPSPSQSPTPPPSAEELRLTEENKILTLKKTNAELKKAIREAQPQPSATPLEGKTELDAKVTIEVEMMSYKAASRAAETIGMEIHNKAADAKAIAIYSANELKDWRFYTSMYPAFEGRLKVFREKYEKALGKTPGLEASPASIVGAFEAGATILSSFVDLLALIRTDTKIEGVDVTINRRALVNELLRALRNKYQAIALYNPSEFPPQLYEEIKDKEGNVVGKIPMKSKTLTSLGNLFLLRSDTDDMISRLKEIKTKTAEIEKLKSENEKTEEAIKQNLVKAASLNKSLDALQKRLKKAKKGSREAKALAAEISKTTEAVKKLTAENTDLEKRKKEATDKTTQLQARIGDLNKSTANLKATLEDLIALNTAFESFVAELITPAAGATTNPLTVFIKAENLDAALQQAVDFYWLEINAAKAGGNNRVRRNLIRFFTGAKVDHSGGVIVDYTLYDRTGNVVRSDKLSVYEGYMEPKRIQKNSPDAVHP